MKFLADENFDKPVIEALRKSGLDVLSATENFPSVDDQTILNKANQEERILLTCDKDFGELIYRLKIISTGIVLLRLPDFDNDQKAKTILSCIREHGSELAHSFTVITANKIRVISL